MNNRQYKRLELTWYNKDKVLLWDEEKKEYFWVEPNDIRVSEPRILIEKETVGKPNSLYKKVITHDKGKLIPEEKKEWQWIEVSDLPQEQQNLLIKGDNLLALKALEQDFTGKIKLIYIDPPFNTGNAFEYYDDGLEHSIWLSMMKNRLEILHKLLRKDGVIFVHIDNYEVGYLRTLMDEIFLKMNFVQMISEKRASPAGFKTINPGPLTVTDYILMYAKDKDHLNWKPYYIPVDYDENYDLVILNPEENPTKWEFKKVREIIYGQYRFESWRDAKRTWGQDWKIIRKALCGTYALENVDRIVSIRDPHKPSEAIKNLLNRSKEERDKIFVLEREKYDDIYIINGGALSFYKNKIREINGEMVPTELLTDMWNDMNYAGIAKEGGVEFKNNKKPEMLLKRIIEMSTEPNDWVLDSFLGSGTTAAVAHKMGRKWIGIELFEKTMVEKALPRLKRVISGEDQTGISKEVNWKGGGGFKYCVLGESLFKVDKETRVIELTYDNGPMIEAVCKIEGFKFVGMEFVNKTKLHGVVNGIRYCHITEEFVTQDYVDELSSEIKENESLVIYCLGYQSKLKLPQNMEIKKIPRDVAKKFILNSNRGKGNGPGSR